MSVPSKMGSVSDLHLTERMAAQEVWPVISRSIRSNNDEIFISFLERFPHNVRYFRFLEPFADSDDIKDNKKMKRHAHILATALIGLMDHINTGLTHDRMIRRLGEVHCKHNVELSSFEELKATILLFVERFCGTDLTSKQFKAWEKVLNCVFQDIMLSMEAYKAKEYRKKSREMTSSQST